MDNRSLEKLEFNKVLEKLKKYCLLPLGQELAEALVPYRERDLISGALDQTDQGKYLLRTHPTWTVRGAKEIRNHLERCRRGGVLAPEELLDVRDTLRTGRQMRNFLTERKEECSALWSVLEFVQPQKELEDEIAGAIGEDGLVVDGASADLAQLRKSKTRLQKRIRETMEGILRNPNAQKMLQELLITQRSERYVVPVKQEYRGAFSGIVHDQSASGATLFIEPTAVVQMGNELKETVLKEEREVQRILQQLSGNIGTLAEPIEALYEGLAKIDFILAKAHLSNEMNAGRAHLAEHQEIDLRQARHPLLKGKVVPLTLEMGRRFHTLVVTGPNTGGKTVALKTIGLCVFMNQAGLHIPAEAHSSLGLFTQVFVDIGDEQSVEQSLSTFSGHLKNIVYVMDHADHHSLILLDEVGAGTDPTEGAALAMAILAVLHERGCTMIATTHYGALKNFAYQTERVENASVEFDLETLRPTYRLLVGIPGRSNAFNIAGRLGLGEQVLERAKTYLSEREMQVTDLLENLEDTQREIESERQKTLTEREAIARAAQDLEQRSMKMTNEHQLLILKAKEEAAELVRQARREADALIDEMKEAIKAGREDQQTIEKARLGMRKLAEKVQVPQTGALQGETLAGKKLKPGQSVYMIKLKQKGHILQLPNGSGEVLVQAGVMKVTVPLSELQLIEEQPSKPSRNKESIGRGKLGLDKSESLRSEIDLRGMMVEEATYTLDKYLDDAALSGVSQVYIIHGKGTGALRSGIQDFLRGHPHVRTFRLGQHGEGDFGVTVAELK